MDEKLKVIEALANGVNPLTGEELPADSMYNHPEIIRALFATLDHIKDLSRKVPKPKLTVEQKQAENISNNRPKNAGLPWLEENKHSLAHQFQAGQSLAELAEHFGRSYGAIESELKKQGLISDG